MPDAAPRDEPRIRHNMTRYLEAVGVAGQHEWKARQAREEAAAALRDLRAAGGHAEAERLAPEAAAASCPACGKPADTRLCRMAGCPIGAF